VTEAEAFAALGLEQPDLYAAQMAAGGFTQTGRSTHTLVKAALAAISGRNVAITAAYPTVARRMADDCVSMCECLAPGAPVRVRGVGRRDLSANRIRWESIALFDDHFYPHHSTLPLPR